jgi:RHS repeat-associated protein
VDAEGARTEWAYDSEGRLLHTTDAAGAVSSFEPGPFGLVRARTGSDGLRIEFDYDGELNLRSVVNAAGSAWTYTYDAAGRLIGETDFTGRTLTYELDAVGRLAARTTGMDDRITIDRDPAGRIIARYTPDAEYIYAYDSAGHLVAATGAGTSLSYTRDVLGRIIAEAVDGRTTFYSFDAVGRRMSRTTPSGATSEWSFDLAGRPTLLDAGSGKLGFGYDSAGNEVVRGIGNDVRLTREHDLVGRLTAQHLWTGAGSSHGEPFIADAAESGLSRMPVVSRTWTWRADSVPIRVEDSLRGVRHLTPDTAGRITAVSGSDWSESYAYDAHGNLANATMTGAESALGNDEQSGVRVFERTLLRTAGRTHYTHDPAGRLVRTVRRTLDGRQRTWEYIWDAEDRLVQAAVPDGSTGQYRYDPLGRRISKTQLGSDGNVQQHVVFVWDGPVLAEQQSRGSANQSFAVTWDYEPDSFTPAAQRRRSWATDAEQELIDDVFHAIVTDLVGTPTELIDGTGRVAWRTTTSLWGRVIATAADPDVVCLLCFPGQYLDSETGLHYNLHRYYDPGTGSYLTPDPLGLEPAPNDRAYVPNPLTFTDPLGLMCARKAPKRPDPAPVDPPADGTPERRLWQLTEEGSTKIMKGGPFKTTFYKSASDGTWWTPDVFGHGQSAFKVYQESAKGLDWIADADKYGTYMPDKHKGDTGKFIPWSQLRG